MHLPEETIRQQFIRIQRSKALAKPEAPPQRPTRAYWLAAASVAVGIGFWWQTHYGPSPARQPLAIQKKRVPKK